MLFVKPLVADLRAVKGILQVFGDASGLKVNYTKSVATLIRGSDEERLLVQNTLECKLEDFHIKYLGLQLAVRPLTRAEWKPMIDKATAFMSPWQQGLMGREGRLVQAKSVSASMPIHHPLVTNAPL